MPNDDWDPRIDVYIDDEQASMYYCADVSVRRKTGDIEEWRHKEHFRKHGGTEAHDYVIQQAREWLRSNGYRVPEEHWERKFLS